jgi:hypothetical protein
MAEADLVMSDTPLKVADPEPEPATILLNEDEGLETPPLVVKAPLVDVEAEAVAESLLLEDEPVEDEPAAILLNEDEGLETPLLDVDAEAVADSLLVEDEPVKDEDEFEASSLETVVATEADRHCPDCDAVLLPDAIFCSECGRTVSEPGASENKISPPPPGLDTNACPRCGTSLLSEADFCAECGHRVV